MTLIGDISGKKFDYIIIGGGTSGLTLAARLAENHNITVAVLEAGPSNLDDPLINIPNNIAALLGNPKYDWAFMTTPQKYANNKQALWSRGKTLGGSSAINVFIWSKPFADDINALGSLGNPGWNWEQYTKYSQKTEGLILPSEDRRQEWCSYYNKDSHGYTGNLSTGFARIFSESDIIYHDTLKNMGIEPAKNFLGGDPARRSMAALTISGKDYTRSYAAKAFYVPNIDKPNLKVLCDALVLRLLTKSEEDGLLAEGVEFEYNGEVHEIFAQREVILSTGALKTPQILELSGIGDRASAILEPLGISTKVDLPGVGSNVQEHTWSTIGWEMDPTQNFVTVDKLGDPEVAAEQLKLHPQGEGLYCVAYSSIAFLPLKAVTDQTTFNDIVTKQRRHLEERISSGSLALGLKEQFDIQMQTLEGKGADCEFLHYPGHFSFQAEPDLSKNYSTVIIGHNHPFSRGTVHITSNDPHLQAAMDPHYFEEDIDLQTLRLSSPPEKLLPHLQ